MNLFVCPFGQILFTAIEEFLGLTLPVEQGIGTYAADAQRDSVGSFTLKLQPSERDIIKAGQQAWAARKALTFDSDGYCRCVGDNIQGLLSCSSFNITGFIQSLSP